MEGIQQGEGIPPRRLIILNGPSGVGKSTLAEKIHMHMPNSVLISIDAVRSTIPDYREKRVESLRLAYETATKAAEDNLQSGKDVIIDKNILDPEVLDTFIASAKKHGAQTYEFHLFADKDSVQKRADDRGYKVGGLLTPQKVGEHWTRSDELRSQRKSAIAIDTNRLSPEEVFNLVSSKLDSDI